MATRAAIAYADRKSREDIADKDRAFNKKKWAEEKKIKEYNAHTDRVTKSASAAGQLARGAGSLLSKSNHPEFYKKLPGTDLLAKLPTFYRAGTKLFTGWYGTGVGDIVPGICVIWFQSSIPNYHDMNTSSDVWMDSSLNMALTRFMANLRKRNSRIGEYDPSDIGLYFYSVAEYLYDICKISLCIKIYNTYYAENAYFAKALIAANGYDPVDFCANIAAYKMLYQRHANLFNASIVVPKDITFLQRRAWMASTLVKDHKANRAQVYLFRRYSVGSLSATENCVTFTAATSKYVYSTYSSGLENRVRNLINSTGIVTMIADLRAAYNSGDLLTFPEMNGTEKVEFSDSDHDLEQIHNIQTAPMTPVSTTLPSLVSKMNIYSDSTTGYLFQGTKNGSVIEPMVILYGSSSSAQQFTGKGSTLYENSFLNFYDDAMVDEVDSILEATRLRVVTFKDHYGTGNNHFVVKTCGTEIPLCFEIIRTIDGSASYQSIFFGSTIQVANIDNTVLKCLALASAFDWFPVIWVEDGGVIDDNLTFGEIDHPVLISNANLKQLHEFCSYSEFYCED